MIYVKGGKSAEFYRRVNKNETFVSRRKLVVSLETFFGALNFAPKLETRMIQGFNKLKTRSKNVRWTYIKKETAKCRLFSPWDMCGEKIACFVAAKVENLRRSRRKCLIMFEGGQRSTSRFFGLIYSSCFGNRELKVTSPSGHPVLRHVVLQVSGRDEKQLLLFAPSADFAQRLVRSYGRLTNECR